MLNDEATLIVERINIGIVNHAIIMRRAITSLISSDGNVEFRKMIESLAGENHGR